MAEGTRGPPSQIRNSPGRIWSEAKFVTGRLFVIPDVKLEIAVGNYSFEVGRVGQMDWLSARILGIAAVRANGGGMILLAFLIVFDFIVDPGKVLWAVKTQPAFSATIGPPGKKKQHPEFNDPPAFGPMNVRASALGAGSLHVIDKHSKYTLHWHGMIPPHLFRRNARLPGFAQ